MYGGKSNGYRQDVQEYNFDSNTWTKIDTKGKQPSGRYGHSAVIYSGKMYIWGGYDNSSMTANDMYTLDFDTFTWSPVTQSGSIPTARYSHGAAFMSPHYWIIFGGAGDGNAPLNDAHIFNLSNNTWTQIKASGTTPTARFGHSISTVGTSIYLFGGFDKKKAYSDMHELISTGNKWSWKLIEVSQDTQPSPRLYHVLSSVNNGFFIYSGRSEDNKVSATLFHHCVEHSAFDALPIETILHIFSFLKPKDLARVAVVCKLWKEISESDDLWKPRVIEAIGDIAPYKETLEEMKTFKKILCCNITSKLPSSIL